MPNHRRIADQLLRKGYRVISRKYTKIARIDCEPDEYLNRMVKDSHLNVHRYSFFIEEWYDYYRRVLSKDRQCVSPGVMNEMTRSFPTRVFTEIFAATLKDDGTVRCVFTEGGSMIRGLEFNTVWHRDGSYRQVVGQSATHVKWANLCSAHCEHHWQRIASWLKWVDGAEEEN